jgi:hypothetical protein
VGEQAQTARGAPSMGIEQEVKVLWNPDGGNPNREDKGAGEEQGQEGPRGSVRWKSEVEYQTEQCKALCRPQNPRASCPQAADPYPSVIGLG